jgi:hypothetical protein
MKLYDRRTGIEIINNIIEIIFARFPHKNL